MSRLRAAKVVAGLLVLLLVMGGVGWLTTSGQLGERTDPAPITEPAGPVVGTGGTPGWVHALAARLHADLDTLVAVVEAALVPDPVWEVVGTEVVVADDERPREVLRFWADGNMGFVELDGGVHGFAANGPRTTRWRVGEDRFLGEVVDAEIEVEGVDDGVTYAAGGPVLVDEDTGALLMLYHGERTPEAPVVRDDFWSFVGLAVSTDGGVTFTDRGAIVTPEVAIDHPDRSFAVEVGGGPFVVGDDGNVYVYFRDVIDEEHQLSVLNLAVARAPLDDVVADALAGQATAWQKFDGEGWGEPGLGGQAADLLPDAPHPNWFDVVHLADAGVFVLVASHGGGLDWQVWGSVSRDGLVWSEPQVVLEDAEGHESLYVSLSSPDLASQRVVRGDVVHVYRTRSTIAEGDGATRWDGEVTIERTDLRIILD